MRVASMLGAYNDSEIACCRLESAGTRRRQSTVGMAFVMCLVMQHGVVAYISLSTISRVGLGRAAWRHTKDS